MKGHCGAVSKPINIHERGCDRGARTDHCYCPWARPSLMNIHKVHKTGMFWFRRSGGQNAAGTERSMGGGGVPADRGARLQGLLLFWGYSRVNGGGGSLRWG